MIALLTATGGRQKQIELCARWMKNQTYKGKVLWVIVDDCEPVTTNFITSDFRENWEIVKIYPHPKWQPGMESTQSRNLSLGLVEIKKIISNLESFFIIEDDDYYKPVYLERMMSKINGFDVIGEKNTIYYNIPNRCWHRNANEKWSSLFQTAVTPNAIPIFESCLFNKKFIDCILFRNTDAVNLFNDGNLSVGIKGLPGRSGMGIGHRNMSGMQPDPDYKIFKELIGEDSKYYLE